MRTQRSASRPQAKDSQAGFTLIEILISLVLLVGGLISFVVLTGNVVGHSAENERKTQAVVRAQEKIEDLKNQFLNANLTAADNGNDTVDNIFTRTWTISNHPSGNNLVILDVQVNWMGHSGPESVDIKTLLSQ
ncbi:MAG: prepilin-type N-terminal cleavage/methylation domain-containing protein [Nitrospinaceae bacterium]